jgi:hypothetical protein
MTRSDASTMTSKERYKEMREKILEAMSVATEKVIEESIRLNEPLVISVNGEVVFSTGQQIPDELKAARETDKLK